MFPTVQMNTIRQSQWNKRFGSTETPMAFAERQEFLEDLFRAEPTRLDDPELYRKKDQWIATVQENFRERLQTQLQTVKPWFEEDDF